MSALHICAQRTRLAVVFLLFVFFVLCPSQPNQPNQPNQPKYNMGTTTHHRKRKTTETRKNETSFPWKKKGTLYSAPGMASGACCLSTLTASSTLSVKAAASSSSNSNSLLSISSSMPVILPASEGCCMCTSGYRRSPNICFCCSGAAAASMAVVKWPPCS